VTTLLVTDPIFLEHLVPSGHPERPDRLRAISRALAADRFADLKRVAAPAAEATTLALAHDPAYVAAVLRKVGWRLCHIGRATLPVIPSDVATIKSKLAFRSTAYRGGRRCWRR
jgi:hypothetical protein